MHEQINWQEIPAEERASAIDAAQHARDHGHPLPVLIGLDAWERTVSAEHIGGQPSADRRLGSLLRLARRNHNQVVQTGRVQLTVRRRTDAPNGERQTTRLAISLYHDEHHGASPFVSLDK